MGAYSAFRSRGTLPAAGGLWDQSRAWVRLSSLCDAEIGKLQGDRDRTFLEDSEAKRRRQRLVPGSS